MKEFKVTVTGTSGSLSYTVLRKTAKSVKSFAKKIAKDAFYGEVVTFEIKEI
jgi:hypothetical protein